MGPNRICSCCGKSFMPAAYHMYRANKGWQCSYTCYRKEGGDGGIARGKKSDLSVSKMRSETKK